MEARFKEKSFGGGHWPIITTVFSCPANDVRVLYFSVIFK